MKKYVLVMMIASLSLAMKKDSGWGLDDIEAINAWKYSQGSSNVVVAVIDTGIGNHERLSESLWTNPQEIPHNEIDDDNNGYIDDVHGWNFANNSPDLSDSNSHGTHIAGIIHSVAPKIKMMILKYDGLDASSDSLSSTIRAIHYATAHGAHIINFSGGGRLPSESEKIALVAASRKGILIVAAAGNNGGNLKYSTFYPAGYNLSNILAVTAIDQEATLLPTSNYHESLVGIAAPGKDILSTLPQNRFGYMTGTSQATAFVSGVAALLKSAKPELDAIKLKKIIIAKGDFESGLRAKTLGGKKLNARRVLSSLEEPIE